MPEPFIIQANPVGAISRSWRDSARNSLRFVATPLVHGGREGAARAQAMLRTRGRGPRVVFLPAYGRHGAALLRIYNVAAALRGFGWKSVILPSSLNLKQRHRLLASVQPDVVIMQGARHPLNRPELYPEHRVLFDMDDADFHLPHLQDPVRQAMGHVAGVLAGSEYVADWCRTAGAKADVIWTASPVSGRRAVPQAQRLPVVAWAQSRPVNYTAEADWVLEVMRRLSRRCPDVRLRLYDRKAASDPAFLARFRSAGIKTEWLRSTNYRHYLRSFDDVSLGLAPLSAAAPFSRGKSFGKVLAYLDRRVPVIASDACEHGAFFDAGTGVVSNDMDVWVSQASRLLADPRARQTMADAAFERFEQRLSIGQVCHRIDQVMRRSL